ncbi:UDP-2,4-diacetamido-2,4,6-trideoxy-beta-L-altropyranose hydrolase [Nautilia sp.]
MQLLRVDFGSKIGFGHLKRVEAFLEWRMKNGEWRIVCKECDEKYTDIPLIKIKNNDEFFEVVKKLSPKKVIVDNYDFTLEDEKKFKELFPEIKLICFDDFEKEHFCDEVVSLNPCTKHKKIRLKLKKRYIKRDGIMICIGATDPKGIIFKILKYLNGNIHIYTTSKNPNLDKLKRVAKLKKISFHIDKDTKTALFKHKFAIVSASTLSIEALEAEIPFIAIKVVENQKEIAKCLKKLRVQVLNLNEIRKLNDIIFNKQFNFKASAYLVKKI